MFGMGAVCCRRHRVDTAPPHHVSSSVPEPAFEEQVPTVRCRCESPPSFSELAEDEFALTLSEEEALDRDSAIAEEVEFEEVYEEEGEEY